MFLVGALIVLNARCSADGGATTAPSFVLRQSTAVCSMPEIKEDGVYDLNITAVPKRKWREDGDRWGVEKSVMEGGTSCSLPRSPTSHNPPYLHEPQMHCPSTGHDVTAFTMVDTPRCPVRYSRQTFQILFLGRTFRKTPSTPLYW